MNIVVTGSLGNISKPLTTELVQKGHTVTVISSNPDKQEDIETLEARAAIGSLGVADTVGVYPPPKAVNRLYIKSLPRKFISLTFVL